MSIFEYDEEAVRRGIRDEAYAEGEAKGKAEGEAKGIAEGEVRGIAKSILLILEKKGSVSEKLRDEILKEKDIEILEGWLGKAAVAKSIEDFLTLF